MNPLVLLRKALGLLAMSMGISTTAKKPRPRPATPPAEPGKGA